MRHLRQNLLTGIIISSAAGTCVVLFSLHLGYKTTFWLVCGLPLGSVVLLWGLGSTPAKLKTLREQLCWWHFLWLLVFLSGQVFRIRDVESIHSNPLDFWALYRVGLMIVVGLVLLDRLIFRNIRWDRSLFQGLIGLMTAYAIISVLSTLWSIYPMWTLYKSLEYLIDVALIAAVVASVRTVKEVKSLFDWTWVLWSCLALTVCLGVAVWPEQAIVHQGLLGLQIRGILPAIETNGVGDVAAILSIVALTRLLFPTEYKRFYLVVLLVSMVMLIFSQSRSPLTGFLVAVALVLFAAKRIRTVTLLCLIIPVVLSFTSLGNLFSEFFQRGQSSKYFDSLSGRVPLWESGWELFNEQPLTGYGAYAAGRFGVIGNLRNTNWSSILNTWLEVLIGTGLIGVMPLLGAFLGMWVMLLRSPPSGTDACSVLQRLRIEGIGVLAILSVRSMFTVEFIWHPPLTFLLVLGYAEMLHRAYRENSYESNYSSATIRRRAVSVQS